MGYDLSSTRPFLPFSVEKHIKELNNRRGILPIYLGQKLQKAVAYCILHIDASTEIVCASLTPGQTDMNRKCNRYPNWCGTDVGKSYFQHSMLILTGSFISILSKVKCKI